MKLTKLQRYTAYCIMLAEIEEYLDTRYPYVAHDGFCYLAFFLFNLTDECGIYTLSLQYFPEIQKKKPKNCGWLWWPANINGGSPFRIAALKECIKETEPK